MISKLDTTIKIINFVVNFISVFLNHFPFLNGTGLRGEVGSDSVELSLIRSIFLGIAPLLYLFQRLLCTPIQLEFKNVNIIPRLYYTIHSSLTLLLLRLHYLPIPQLKDQIQCVLKILLLASLMQAIRYSR